jgi:hypothetical protein
MSPNRKRNDVTARRTFAFIKRENQRTKRKLRKLRYINFCALSFAAYLLLMNSRTTKFPAERARGSEGSEERRLSALRFSEEK